MLVLPDDLCIRILELGIQSETLNYKDLCCLSITCRRLYRLSAEDSLWSSLLFSDFSSSQNDANLNNSASSSKAKVLYKIRFEKDREQRRLAPRMVYFQMAKHFRKIRIIAGERVTELHKIRS